MARLHECSIGAVDCGLPALVHLALDGSPRCDRGPIQHEGLVHLRRSIARGADHLPVSSPSDGNGERARLRRAADVTVVEPTDLRPRNDGAVFGWLHGARLGRVFLERQMRTRAVIVAEVAAQTTTQVPLVQDDDVVEELAADCADHALGEGVLPRRARSGDSLGDADASDPLPKLGAVDAVAIAEQVAGRRVTGERLDDLLRSPGGRGAIGDVEVYDLIRR